MGHDDHTLIRRDAAAPPPDYEQNWLVLRSLIRAGEHASPNHVSMAHNELRRRGRIFEVDCSVMNAWLLSSLSLAILGDLRDERAVRRCAAQLAKPTQRAIRVNKRLLRQVLRHVYDVGGVERADTDTTLLVGCVMVGIANTLQDAAILDVDSYRDACIDWCSKQWPAAAVMQVRITPATRDREQP